MFKVLKNSWALFIGLLLIMTAHGLQGNLLGVRAVYEQFSLISTGIMMSGFYMGYFIGAKNILSLIHRVGHIRVFAAMASSASLVILIHSIYVHPFTWFVARIFSGICMVSIYTIVESWFNERSTNQTRGKVLSIYMMISYFGMGSGMLLLNFQQPESFEPFILISILMSLSLIPILLTKRKPPSFKKIQNLTISELYKISPLGVVSSVLTGFIHSAIFTLLAVYAASMKFTLVEIGFLTFLLTVSGALAQFPIGYVSDLLDRRKIIAICSLLGAGAAFVLIFLSSSIFSSSFFKFLFYVFVIFYAFCSLPLFSLNLSHTNDFISKDKFVAAGAGLQFAFALGAIAGPFVCSLFMGFIGPEGFFIFLVVGNTSIGFFALYRMKVGSVVDSKNNQFFPIPRSITPMGMELNPAIESEEENKV
jgi:MFS family permease